MGFFTDREHAEFSLAKAMRLAGEGELNGCLEYDMSQEVARAVGKSPTPNTLFLHPEQLARLMRRDMTVAGVSGSNYLVGTQTDPWRDLLRPWSIAANAGAQILSDLTGNVTLPATKTTAAGYWLPDENAQVTPGQPIVGQVTLTPKNAVVHAAHTHQLRAQAVNLDAFLARDLGKSLGTMLDGAILNGAGSSGEPLGLHSMADVATVDGTSITWADVQELLYGVALANAPETSIRWIGAPDTRQLLSTRVMGTDLGGPIWNGREIAGFGANVTTAAPASSLTVGAWSELVIGLWGAVEIVSDPMSNFRTGVTSWRAWMTADVAALSPAAFGYSVSIT